MRASLQFGNWLHLSVRAGLLFLLSIVLAGLMITQAGQDASQTPRSRINANEVTADAAVDLRAGFQMLQTPTWRVEVRLVTVGVRVTDFNGSVIPNLRQPDFLVFEDGIPQQIAFFSSEKQPISLGVLLDKSESMRGSNLILAKATARLIYSALPKGSEYLYMPFACLWSRDPLPDFTEDLDQVLQAIASTDPGGGTCLYDSIVTALERCRHAKNGRQALVVITDGEDQYSNHTLNGVIRAVRESQVQVFAIGYFGPRARTHSNLYVADSPWKVFPRLARESGAETFFPESDEDRQSAAQRITDDLNTQYTLAYYPSNPARDGRYRSIKVNVKGLKGVRVRARAGYVLPSSPTSVPVRPKYGSLRDNSEEGSGTRCWTKRQERK